MQIRKVDVCLPGPQSWFTTLSESQGLMRAIWCTSLLFQFYIVYRDLFKLTGTDSQIKDLRLTIAGLSEYLIRDFSDVYEIQLRFVSADGSVIF